MIGTFKTGKFSVGMKTILKYNPDRVIRHALDSGEKALAKLASFVWTKAHQSIRNKHASKPGTAMGRGTGFMRDSLVVQRIDDRELHIGFYRGAWVGDLHEWGGIMAKKRPRPKSGIMKYRSEERWRAKYPARPTMRLALEKSERDFERKFPMEFARFFARGGDFASGSDIRPARMRLSA